MTTINYSKIHQERLDSFFNGYIMIFILPILVLNVSAVLAHTLQLDSELNDIVILITEFKQNIFQKDNATITTVWTGVLFNHIRRHRNYALKPTITLNQEIDSFLKLQSQATLTNESIQALKSRDIPEVYLRK